VSAVAPLAPIDRALVQVALARMSASTCGLARQLYREGALRHLTLHGEMVRAHVASSRGRGAYEVRGPVSSLRCECSWGTGCKHIALVLIALTEHLPARSAPLESAPPAKSPLRAPPLPVPLQAWLGQLGPASERPGYRLAFLLDLAASGPVVHVARQAPTRSGWATPQRLHVARVAKLPLERFAPEGLEWLDVLANGGRSPTKLRGRAGHFIVTQLAAAGRLYVLGDVGTAALSLGPALEGQLTWSSVGDTVRPTVTLTEPDAHALPTVPALYVHPARSTFGPIEHPGAPDQIAKWLSCPAIDPEAIEQVKQALPPNLPPPRIRPLRTIAEAPRGVLTLFQAAAAPGSTARERYATVAFRYGGHAVRDGQPMGNGILTVDTPDEQLRIVRQLAVEHRILLDVIDAGFLCDPIAGDAELPRPWELGDVSDWITFLTEGAAELRAKGIDVETDASFKLEIFDVDSLDARLESSAGIDWFELDVGVRVGDQRVDLVPILIAALRAGELPTDGEPLYVPMHDGSIARVSHERIAPLVEVLLDLVSFEPSGVCKLSRLRAMDLAEGLALEGMVAKGLRSLRQTLTGAKKLPATPVPRTLKAKLRDYQRDGFRWLSFLGEHGIGAVLADDMGLGKTLQLIALIVSRRAESGGAPSLVVAPTSVLLSWTEQLARFAPHLAVVRWDGKDRHAERERLPQVDLVLTSYALLHRDAEVLRDVAWDILVLDEAQAIKNPKAVAGDAARSLRARQRVAVTGTPLENHLGELWSIFSFAVPGALGTEPAFKQAFRNPIERLGDTARLATLRRRVAPLMLRRTKEQVAAELPPKTVIEVPIELGDAQRDLYETVRRSVDKRVREEIARRGLAMSKIVILDALLKLRQVCCDPSLLKLQTRKSRVASAKRDAFVDLIQTLVGEERRVLVFSQFVEMLELLAGDLHELGIHFSLLTGSTVDRERQVRQFQDGQVPVFLISLKAGGVGLNLTAADTVIHYDPWWNPAVEAQATDRAHRIGQTKPVFVHRLVAKGTVEEKIVALQAKKAELARALLEGGTQALALDEAAIADLLAPMPRE
jgi:superfamily II DNA or RNA helicase